VLSECERSILCEIEQRLLTESSTLVHAFHGVTPHPPDCGALRVRLRVLALAVSFGVFALLGPAFNEAEVTVRMRPPAPRTTPVAPTPRPSGR